MNSVRYDRFLGPVDCNEDKIRLKNSDYITPEFNQLSRQTGISLDAAILLYVIVQYGKDNKHTKYPTAKELAGAAREDKFETFGFNGRYVDQLVAADLLVRPSQGRGNQGYIPTLNGLKHFLTPQAAQSVHHLNSTEDARRLLYRDVLKRLSNQDRPLHSKDLRKKCGVDENMLKNLRRSGLISTDKDTRGYVITSSGLDALKSGRLILLV